jgi:hypothetical protein
MEKPTMTQFDVSLMYRLFVTTAATAALFYGTASYTMFWGDRFLAPVHKGMTMTEVRRLVGDPKKIVFRTNEPTVWSYSPPWDDGVVYFDMNGFVSAVETD